MRCENVIRKCDDASQYKVLSVAYATELYVHHSISLSPNTCHEEYENATFIKIYISFEGTKHLYSSKRRHIRMLTKDYNRIQSFGINRKSADLFTRRTSLHKRVNIGTITLVTCQNPRSCASLYLRRSSAHDSSKLSILSH